MFRSWERCRFRNSSRVRTGVLIMASSAWEATLAFPDCWRQRMKLMSNWGAVKNPPVAQVAEEAMERAELNASLRSRCPALYPTLKRLTPGPFFQAR